MIKIDSKISFDLERAVKFLVEEYGKTGDNPKPVIMHSLRIAIYLLEAGYPYEVVAGALLHDLLEDASISLDIIRQELGNQIADIVAAVSFDPQINDPEQNYKEMFQRTKEAGRPALLIKAADLLNNSYYYDLAPADKHRDLIKKIGYFLELSQPKIGTESVWQELGEQYQKINI